MDIRRYYLEGLGSRVNWKRMFFTPPIYGEFERWVSNDGCLNTRKHVVLHQCMSDSPMEESRECFWAMANS